MTTFFSVASSEVLCRYDFFLLVATLIRNKYASSVQQMWICMSVNLLCHKISCCNGFQASANAGDFYITLQGVEKKYFS